MESSQRRTALITGASSGIGCELANIFAKEGNNVVLVARRKEILDKLVREIHEKHSVDARSCPIDLSETTAPDQIYEFMRGESLPVDYLVNNAGFGTRGFFWKTDTRSQVAMMQVNIVSLVHLTSLFLPEMLSRGKGRILNVASMAAFLPGPLMAVYFATKAFILSFSEALSSELKGSGVTVTVLCPGPTKTGFQTNPKVGSARWSRQWAALEVEPVAMAGYRGMMNGTTIVIPGLKNKVGRGLLKMAPRNVSTRAAKWLNEDAT